jgi:protein-tyrosine phosphatase
MLDGTASDEGQLRELLDTLAALNGGVYVHCAQGHGRSAMVVAAMLIRRRIAVDVDDAEMIIRSVRPGARLNTGQRRMVARVVGERATLRGRVQ